MAGRQNEESTLSFPLISPCTFSTEEPQNSETKSRFMKHCQFQGHKKSIFTISAAFCQCSFCGRKISNRLFLFFFLVSHFGNQGGKPFILVPKMGSQKETGGSVCSWGIPGSSKTNSSNNAKSAPRTARPDPYWPHRCANLERRSPRSGSASFEVGVSASTQSPTLRPPHPIPNQQRPLDVQRSAWSTVPCLLQY